MSEEVRAELDRRQAERFAEIDVERPHVKTHGWQRWSESGSPRDVMP